MPTVPMTKGILLLFCCQLHPYNVIKRNSREILHVLTETYTGPTERNYQVGAQLFNYKGN